MIRTVFYTVFFCKGFRVSKETLLRPLHETQLTLESSSLWSPLRGLHRKRGHSKKPRWPRARDGELELRLTSSIEGFKASGAGVLVWISYIYIYIIIYICTSVYVCIYICVYIYIYIYTYVCFLCISMCEYIHMYTYYRNITVYMHTFITYAYVYRLRLASSGLWVEGFRARRLAFHEIVCGRDERALAGSGEHSRLHS